MTGVAAVWGDAGSRPEADVEAALKEDVRVKDAAIVGWLEGDEPLPERPPLRPALVVLRLLFLLLELRRVARLEEGLVEGRALTSLALLRPLQLGVELVGEEEHP